MFTKQKPLLAAALKNWHSCQFSLCGCKDADRNGNVPVGWAWGSAALILSHPALCCSSGNSQGTNAPLHIHPEALRALWEAALLPCPAEEQGNNSLPGLRKFLPSSPNAWQKNEQQQRQYLPARQQILANLLPEMPACTLHAQQFGAYSFLPDVELFSQPESCKKDYSVLSLIGINAPVRG